MCTSSHWSHGFQGLLQITKPYPSQCLRRVMERDCEGFAGDFGISLDCRWIVGQSPGPFLARPSRLRRRSHPTLFCFVSIPPPPPPPPPQSCPLALHILLMLPIPQLSCPLHGWVSSPLWVQVHNFREGSDATASSLRTS